MDMEKYIIEQIISICGLEETDFNVEMMLKKDLMISSLDYVRLIASVEDDYQIELPYELQIYEEDMSIEELCDAIRKTIEEEGDKA